MRELNPCTYIMASRSLTLYVGVTSDIYTRVMQHRNGTYQGFTSQYRCERLVWVQFFETMNEAISRESQIKRWRRDKKIHLIKLSNPQWIDLAAYWGKPLEISH